LKLSKIPTLVIGANDIGNSEDLPKRSIDALRAADLLVFEEDRQARRALKAAGIHRPYIRLSEHQEQQTIEAVRDAFMQSQSVFYLCDQGTANICDPGSALLNVAYEFGAKIVVIPGPSSVTSAVAACPLVRPNEGFLFAGLLPRESEDRRKKLLALKALPTTKFILDTPYRIQALVEDCQDVLGDRHLLFLALDISGPNEDYILATPADILLRFKGEKNHLNFVLAFR
jgi:16S rRNA (cytidine1402-2'-O)-methyltransferase